MTVQRARTNAGTREMDRRPPDAYHLIASGLRGGKGVPARAHVPERTCFRCDGVFTVASDDRRVYCPDCRRRYGFPAPAVADFTPGAQLPLFPTEDASGVRCA